MENGITLTNNKGASTSNVADYAKPARFYKNSEVIVEFTSPITKIEFACNTAAYATTLNKSIEGSSLSDKVVTVELDGTSNTYTCSMTEGQVRLDAVTVTYTDGDVVAVPSVSVPVASVAAGVYTAAQSVTFESEYANAENPTISYYYTTDGNEPTKESALLEGALEVAESCTVKVIAVMTVGEEEYTSKVASYEYIISEAAKFVAVTATEQVVAGKVLLVANNLAAHGISGNYGYLPVHNVTEVEGGIENAVYYGAFELEVAEGGWYIKDNNGKYIYMTGTYNSFNVSEEIPAEGAVWTIAITEDGTATITNVAMSKYVQYSTKHTSYGAYAEAQDGGVVPTLYVPYVEPTPEPEVTANAISLAFTRTGTNGESVSVVAVNENGETLENVSVAVATTVDFRPTAGSITEAILCPNVNGNTGADIEMTFTLSNLPEGFSFNNIGLDIHALNGGNRYQENGDNKVRQWNVAVAANDAAFGSLTDIDIAAGIGESGVSVHKVWDIEGAAVESAENSIVIKVNVTSGTKNEGCFFGLSEIQLTTVEVVEPEAPFEVVAVTPSEAVTELSTITVEFSEEIAGEQDLMAMETIYVGSRTNACNFTVDGKVLTITLWTPITAPGEYALKVPASVGITRASNGEAVVIDGEITFTVEEAVVEPETFTVTAALFPTVEGDVTEIKGIRVEAGQGPALAELPTGWTLTNEAGDEFEMNIQWLYDYETILIMVNPAITEAGTYTLTIPAGSLKTEDGKECEAAEFSWTIKDPYMPYNNGTRTRTDRLIKGITLTGASGENSYALTADEQTQDYTDATAVAVFKVEAGEELTITFDKIGEWIHQFVFIDFDGDGFTASIAEGSEWAPAEDLVAYSFYNNDSSDDNYGWNSVGTSITGNDRSTPAVPAFKAPETIGTYRMRVKQDWCNIDPAGDADGKFEDFKANGGQIIDIILEVVEATTGIENVEAETVKAIYDITGRKIEKITKGGIYIVNGKKVLVK